MRVSYLGFALENEKENHFMGTYTMLVPHACRRRSAQIRGAECLHALEENKFCNFDDNWSLLFLIIRKGIWINESLTACSDLQK